MPTGKLTILPHYKQEDPERYCGPASAQMVLEGCYRVLSTQDDLWNAITTDCENGEWYSGPACLQHASNQAAGSPFPFTRSEQSCSVLNCCESPTLPAGCEASRATVLNDVLDAVSGGGAGLTAVMCNLHWVAFCGYESTGGPTLADVTKVYFHDPAPAANSGATDCAKDEWLKNYFNGGLGIPGWFVGLPATSTESLSLTSAGDPDLDTLSDNLTPPAIAAFSVVRASRSLLNRHHPRWTNSVHGAAHREPFNVKRLDTGAMYVLVPIQDTAGKIRVLGQVSADTRRYMATLFSDRAVVLPRAEAEVRAHVATQQFRRPDGTIWVPELKSLVVDRTLVWKPCRESQSPFLPFHRVHSPAGDLYMRVDGPVFTQLTRPLLRGG